MRRRNGQIVIALASVGLVAACGACGGPGEGARGAGPRRLAVSRWSAELPGRPEPLPVTLPTHFDDRLPRKPVDFTLRAEVEVPEEMRGRALTLTIAHMPAVAELRVDGSEAVPVDASSLDSYRATGPHRWRVAEAASQDGKLAFELRVHHRMSRSAWIDSVPELSTDPLGGVGFVHAFNTTAATGALAASAIVATLYVFFFLSLRDKRRGAAYGWFSVGATCGAAYPAFVLGLTQPVFGVYETPFMTVALALGSIAAMFFARAYVRAEPPSRAWWGAFAGIVALTILGRDPFHSIMIMAPVVVGVTLATAVAQLVFIVRLRRAGSSTPLGLYAVAFAWPAAVVLGLPDIAALLGQGEPIGGMRTACVGIMALSLYQAVQLSREHLLALSRADGLVEELAERVKLLQAKHREVELLNDELRRQIAARSRELAEKLAQMDDDEAAAPPPTFVAGDVIEQRYQVVKQLGAGGMGAVYEVVRIADGRHFALKALASGGDANVRARFAREAQIAANVNHPNVVSIVDVDVAKSGYVFLVMELVTDGTTLHDVRRRHRDIPWTLGVLAQVAEGIDAVHEAGIIHRDLKPGNILLARGADGRRPLVKITDFGISSLQDGTRASSAAVIPATRTDPSLVPPSPSAAPSFAPPEGLPAVREAATVQNNPPKQDGNRETTMLVDLELDPDVVADTAHADADAVTLRRASTAPEPASSGRPPKTPFNKRAPETPLTETGIIFGTPQYMAQELTAGSRYATRTSDVFSLGIIAFELLSGRRPFVESPVSAKLAGRPLPTAPKFRQVCPTLSQPIATLLDRTMSHDPRERPTAHEVAIALRAATDKLGP